MVVVAVVAPISTTFPATTGGCTMMPARTCDTWMLVTKGLGPCGTGRPTVPCVADRWAADPCTDHSMDPVVAMAVAVEEEEEKEKEEEEEDQRTTDTGVGGMAWGQAVGGVVRRSWTTDGWGPGQEAAAAAAAALLKGYKEAANTLGNRRTVGGEGAPRKTCKGEGETGTTAGVMQGV